MKQRVVKVGTPSGSYHVTIGSNLAKTRTQIIRELKPSALIIVTDSKVCKHQASVLAELKALRFSEPNTVCTIKAGEASKTLATMSKLFDQCLSGNPDRHTLVVALGGGVVGDVAGLLAGTLLRGVRILHLPTSLLAMVDSAIGGKTAVDHKLGKNLIGVFHSPSAVVIDIALLETLSKREYTSALGEVIKYGVVLDAKLFRTLEESVEKLSARDPKLLLEVVAACVQNKARIVSRDPYEKGDRVVLNFGHTVGHAVERLLNYRGLGHGEAIAIGMNVAGAIGVELGVTPERTLLRMRELIAAYKLPSSVPAGMTPDKLLNAMQHDKKRSFGRMKFVLPTRIGKWTTWSPKSRAELKSLLEKACA